MMPMRIYKPGEFAKLIGVTVKTLQNWDKADKLKAYRTVTNKRYYTDEHFEIINKMQKQN